MKTSSIICVFIFYNAASGVQHHLAFHRYFKHCNSIIYDGRHWIMLDFDRTGFVMRKINCENGDSLVRNLHIIKDIHALVSISVPRRIEMPWKPCLIRSCNEICRYAAGIDIGITFNPAHLYAKLLRYRHRRNYEILSAWRRKDYGIPRGG